MKTSFIAAGVLVIGLVLWMASGLISGPSAESDTSDGSSASASVEGSDAGATDPDAELMKVQISIAQAESRAREIVLQGQLEPARVLDVRAEISSTIETLPATKGQRIKANDLLATLALNGRDGDLAEANAQVRSAVSEQKAAAQLRKQGLQSEVQSQRANAVLASAQAARSRITRDIENTQITAPFDGILNSLPVELGELVSPGAVIAQLVDDSSFRVSAEVAQQAVSELKAGQSVNVELITGEVLTGKLSFVASVADAQTRSFSIEADVDNPGKPIAAGVSASLRIPVETLDTVFLTPSALSLGDRGELGVKLVDENNIVQFLEVALLSTNIDGAWVSGIPDGTQVITLGQAFVAIGEEVEPVLEDETSSATGS